MITTKDLIGTIKKRNGNCSDYRVAKLMNVNPQTVSAWVHGKRTMSEGLARRAANILGWNELYVVACVRAEQCTGTEVYPIWAAICERLPGVPGVKTAA